jgi:multiple antibiotic resistance protein
MGTLVVSFNLKEVFSAFIVLFTVIDILGSLPIIIALKERGQRISASKATILSFLLMAAFLYSGEVILGLFHVDVQSFAVAGSIIIFLVALEMLLDVEIFKNQGPMKEATLVPLVFPLLAGAAVFTALLSLRAEYASFNILIALTLNMLWVYVVIKKVEKIERLLGKGGIYISRKFFGVILIAIAVRLFTQNIRLLF